MFVGSMSNLGKAGKGMRECWSKVMELLFHKKWSWKILMKG